MSSSDSIVYTREGRIGIVRFNRPPLNISTAAGTQRLEDILTQIENDTELRCVVFCANGKVFAAGSDMNEMQVYLDEGSYVDGKMVTELRVRNRIAYLPMPTIAALDGSAYGGGFDLALACDMRIAAPHIVVSLPEVTLGSFPGSGSAYRITRLMGASRAIQHMLFATPFSAAQALELNLVNAIAQDQSAYELAMQWAQEIAGKSATATRAIKAAVAGIFQADQERLDHLQLDISRVIATSPDFLEGMNAFFEKRAPRFD